MIRTIKYECSEPAPAGVKLSKLSKQQGRQQVLSILYRISDCTYHRSTSFPVSLTRLYFLSSLFFLSLHIFGNTSFVAIFFLLPNIDGNMYYAYASFLIATILYIFKNRVTSLLICVFFGDKSHGVVSSYDSLHLYRFSTPSR